MRQSFYAAAMILILFGRADAAPSALEPVVGLPCENCDLVFKGMPERSALTSVARIAPANEPGERLRIVGRTLDADGKAVAGVIVYAYHTDDRGLYPRDDRPPAERARHGRLRGWAISDKEGRYQFDTIRPAGYPDSDIPSHIHMHVIEVGRCTYWINDINFLDDPRLTAEQRRPSLGGRGGPGLAKPTRDAAGLWHVTRDIVLGKGINGYPARSGT